MKAHLAAFGAGALFAIGLALSGMTKPSKVIGFLDVAGRWDASLGLVMTAAVAVTFVAYRIIRRRSAPLFDAKFHLPTRKDIDGRLVVGAALFGVGWGLGGYCPGPALVAGAGGVGAAIVFLSGMTLGMLIEHAVARLFAHRSHQRATIASDRSGPPSIGRGSPGNARLPDALHPIDKRFGEQP